MPLVLLLALAIDSWLTGNAADVKAHGGAGFVLAGGGKDQDAAMRWFLERSGGGDVVIVRASGADGYNAYLDKLHRVDSVETLLLNTPESAHDAAAAEKIRNAEALFIAGGDQWNYVRLWRGTPAGSALQFLIDRGSASFGGTSAGLAVLGEYVFTAEHDTVTSAQALADPYHEKVTVGTNFLRIAALKNTITDSHFGARDRMGRTLVFLARMLADYRLPEARAIAVDERTAALVDRDGKARVEGEGSVYLIRAVRPAAVCKPGEPLTFHGISVYRFPKGGTFDLRTWTGQGGTAYDLHVERGVIRSTEEGGRVY